EEHERRKPRLEGEDGEARQAEREGDGHPDGDQREEHSEEQEPRHSGREGNGAHLSARENTIPNFRTIDSPRNRSQVMPASGHAMKMYGIGSSASSDCWFHPKRTNSMPHHAKMSANASTKNPATMPSAASPRRPSFGQMSTSKCVPSRT